jgi:hypothetical protein
MDAATLHSVSEVITSVAELVGVVGFLAIVAFLGRAIRQRIQSGADVDMRMLGNTLSVRGRQVSESDALKSVTEVLPSVLNAAADAEARLKALEVATNPALPAPSDNQRAPEPEEEAEEEESLPSAEGRARASGVGSLGQPHLLWIDYRSTARVMQIQQAIGAGWTVSEQGDFDSSVRALEQLFFDGVVYVWRGDGFDFAHVKALTDAIKRQAIDKRTRLLVYDSEARLDADQTGNVLRQGATMVTSSAVDLAVALTGTYCGQCGRLLPEPSAPFPSRMPCPQCGSAKRLFKRELSGTLHFRGNRGPVDMKPS